MHRKLWPFMLLLLVSAQGCAVFNTSGPALGQARYRWLEKRGRPPAAAPASTTAEVNAAPAVADAAGAQPGPEVHAETGPSLFLTKEESRTTEALSAVPPSATPVVVQDTGDYYSEESRDLNAKAVAAAPIGVGTVVLGIGLHSIPFLLVGGALAFTLGLIGSRQCRDRGDRGKGYALVGMILGAAALFLSLMVLLRTA